MASEERRLWVRKNPEQQLAEDFVKEFERLYDWLSRLAQDGSDTSDELRLAKEAAGLFVHHSMYDSLPFTLAVEMPDSGYAESSYSQYAQYETDIKNFQADKVCAIYLDKSKERLPADVVKVVYYQAASRLWLTSWAGPPHITPVFPETLPSS